MMPIHISKDVLQKNGWYIYREANRYEKNPHAYKPHVVGYCPHCDAQRVLIYVAQKENTFIFECSFCKECEKSILEVVK